MNDQRMKLTREQWTRLGDRMQQSGHSWILSSHWKGLGTEVERTGCIAITADPDDFSVLTIFLSHLIQVTIEPFSDDWEDLRYLASQVKVFRFTESTRHPTYYLPCVTVEKGAPE